jgi:hypothetical protein
MAEIVSTTSNGNGHAGFPLSRKAFHRGLPRRVGAIEDELDAQESRSDGIERRVDLLVCRLTAIEKRPPSIVSDPALTAQFGNIIEAIVWLADQMRLRNSRGQFIRSGANADSRGRRLAQSRRVASIVNQVADPRT